MKIIKFGGKTLTNGQNIENVISILKSLQKQDEKFIIVLSSRGNTTNELEELLELSRQKRDIAQLFESFKSYQVTTAPDIDFSAEFKLLQKVFEGVSLVEDYSLKIKDLVLAQGEIIAAKLLTFLLEKEGISAKFVDSRKYFVTDDDYGNARIKKIVSEAKTKKFFEKIPNEIIPITTGFISTNSVGETTTLGRNGSNYSASLLAKYLGASEVLSFTNVAGIFTANPDQVADARIIENLTYQEANELANFGATILHAKTIIPLIESNIPLRILSIDKPESKGTLISNVSNRKSVKSITVQSNVSIINIEGRGLLGKIGIDARIFNCLLRENVSIGLISQGSSERSIGFAVTKEKAKQAVNILKQEFEHEIERRDIASISSQEGISIVTVIGKNIQGFSKPFQSLTKNNIKILLINNTLSGNNVSLVVANKEVKKTVNLIHSQIFGISKKINIAIFGRGTVGSSLISQVLESKDKILKRKETKLNIFAIANSSQVVLNENGISENTEKHFQQKAIYNKGVTKIIEFAEKHHLENLILIDNTADEHFTSQYTQLIENGFDIISSNKIANTISFDFYTQLRETLKKHNKQYLYETNVGAGLPLIDTIKLLHESGENITKIRGIFSGSLSYLFNNFSESKKPFSEILSETVSKGFTEPDPREDLCGNDVARKLLILARELDLENEFTDIEIENLIPEELRESSVQSFLQKLEELNPHFEKIKSSQDKNHVLRYVGDLYGNLQSQKGKLKVKLASVSKNSSLGQVANSDSIFEIYTESYGENPIVIQGAGAGAEVTARGVFGDLLRISASK